MEIIDWPKPVKKYLFKILGNLSFPKSPEIDPPPGGDPDFRKLIFARGPKTPANKLSIIDWPKAVKIDFPGIYKFIFRPSPENDSPPEGGITFPGN